MFEPTLDSYGGKFVIKHALLPTMAAKMGMKESKGFGTTGMMAFMLEFESFVPLRRSCSSASASASSSACHVSHRAQAGW